MPSHNQQIDEYINKSADFAKPILVHVRQLVHTACPDVKEAIKWSFPNFEYRGSILCNLAAFKNHCSFGFWLSSVMKDPYNLLKSGTEKNAMGNFGQIKSVADLPSDKIFISYIKQAMQLIEQGVKLPRTQKKVEVPEIPPALQKALKESKKASANFEKLSPSHKKEYVEWITEAKTEPTQLKRIATTIEWITEGKSRNWKYERQ